jgi:TRAF-type zinc finger
VTSRAVAAIIDTLVLRCPSGGGAAADNAPLCSWQGPVRELAAHQSACTGQRAHCKWAGCSEIMASTAVDAHAIVCIHRYEFCELCRKAQQGAEAIASHPDSCEGKPVTCINAGCSAKVCRSDMGLHRSTCAFEIVPCTIPGCGVRVKRGEMNQHCEAASGLHTVALAGFAQTLHDSIKSLNGNLQKLNSNVRRLAARLNAAEQRHSSEDTAAGKKRKKT